LSESCLGRLAGAPVLGHSLLRSNPREGQQNPLNCWHSLRPRTGAPR